MGKDYKYEMEKALELRNYEIDNFWKRGWFFGALIMFLLSANFKLHEIYPKDLQPYSIIVSFLASVTAISQTYINRGSKYWQERWEYIAKNRELLNECKISHTSKEEYHKISACILDKEEIGIARAKRISVSKLTFLVWDLLAFACSLNWINEVFLFIEKPLPITIMLFIFHTIAVVYIFIFINFGSIRSTLDIGEYKNRKIKIKELKESFVGDDTV